MNGKYSQNLLGHAKQSATDALKTSTKSVIQKTAEATGDLTGNKTANKVTKVSRNSQQNNLDTFKNENDKEKHLKKDIYLQKKDKKLLMI